MGIMSKGVFHVARYHTMYTANLPMHLYQWVLCICTRRARKGGEGERGTMFVFQDQYLLLIVLLFNYWLRDIGDEPSAEGESH